MCSCQPWNSAGYLDFNFNKFEKYESIVCLNLYYKLQPRAGQMISKFDNKYFLLKIKTNI